MLSLYVGKPSELWRASSVSRPLTAATSPLLCGTRGTLGSVCDYRVAVVGGADGEGFFFLVPLYRRQLA